MALRRAISKRLLNKNREPLPLLITHETSLSNKSNNIVPLNAARTNFHREYLTSPESSETGFFRRFLHRRAFYQSAKLPEFLSVPVGEKLKEKLRSVNVSGDRLRFDGLSPPATVPAVSGFVGGISVQDAKKIMRSVQLEKVRSALRRMPVNSVSYSEYVQVCVDVCSNRDQGVEYAKKLDESGDVIVLGDVVFLRPEQVAKSMEKIISSSISVPNDPRRQELEAMEKQKSLIDQKAQQLVRGELYCGLGFLALQTLGFMRLTFWELTWDVMEPICFFVTSLHFALAYGFFLRTSTEPSFEGFFQRRFRTKQKKLMEAHKFDVERYNQLCRAFYPNFTDVASSKSDRAGGTVFSTVHD